MNKNTNNKILFLAYFFDPSDGVASSRSRSLAKFLKQNGYNITVLNKKTWNESSDKNTFVWGIKCAIYAIKNKNNFTKIYISCGPFLPLLPIAIATNFLNKSLIVDFRDAWSLNIATNYGNETKKLSLKNKIKLYLVRLIEKYVYKNCEYFVVCTQGMKDEYSQLFTNDKKIRLITNGYDFLPEQYRNTKTKNNNMTRYVCLGKFVEYGENKALKCLQLIKNKHKDGSSFCIELVGTNREKCEPLIKKLNMQNHVRWYPLLPYEQALEIAANADFGISIIRDEALDYGTKVFDYIGLGLPLFDTFEENSRFREFFAEYISYEKKNISIEKSKEFQRFIIFEKNLDLFKEPVNHENRIPSRS